MPIEANLRLIRIFFDTATFDDIERDEKIKTEAQLSLIGGTMGLFSGFSIISGIEIIFFVAKFLYRGVAHLKESYLNQTDNENRGNEEINKEPTMRPETAQNTDV